MKYFIDTEFKEKPTTIELISIGIVCEDGREYYALSKDFDLRTVWKDEWLRENVLSPIYIEHIHGDMRNHFSFSRSSVRGILDSFGKTNKQIAREIRYFIANIPLEQSEETPEVAIEFNRPEFYGYYADYDWVVFCWLFGRMIDLPKYFPMYCKDLKQMMDDKGLDNEWKRINCPDLVGEHNALVDAKWNFKLYKKLIGI